MAANRLRIVVIAPLRFPIRRPHAGGLESAVWNEADQLRARGHEVTIIAAEGSDGTTAGSPFTTPALTWPEGAHPTDDTYPASYETSSVPALAHALDVIAAHPERFDVISNHCLHSLPLRRAAELGVPMISTLHTPVDRDMVEAHLAAAHRAGTGRPSHFLSVSEHTRAQWAAAGIESTVLSNAVDPAAWPLGQGGENLVWFGRIVEEKAPHLAIDVAERLGLPLVIAGRIGDERYAEQHLFPRLSDTIRYVGHLSPEELADVVGRSACSIGTPAWEEPFGLVAPEALMCGTPVASFAVGGVSEIASGSVGMATADRGDVAGLAAAAHALIARSRTESGFREATRASAIARFSLTARIGALEAHFARLMAGADSLGSLDSLPEQAA
ncbi:glycosyltransferase involved in cell wall biosynthesis [Glaciihabitans tibetensis]|uniref:D-inositol 3-phosphate glycosyltransferase n=1 Tax=Glaciihabitans tibetensis TaxID=1266600 RepID=A0A2T0VC02_9MICO|nr:glycosyltransferase [Glaciihabitans tibetensis]PRY67681.1 glycosyltransferase involved in cell wall biosynthesis [Glaciihabitans tibetensis]